MLIVLVFIHVKADRVEEFKEITLDNARHSLQEPGFLRFDVIQQQDDPTRFILFEAYRDPGVPARHKETAHYNRWRETVTHMMAEPRYSIKYENVFPPDDAW
ncbi:MAG: antibiotic biosynthesis monooxygenase [PVC group bacterium]